MKCLALLVQYGGSLDKLSADHKESAIISAYKKQSTKALKFIRLLKDEALTKDGHDLLELEAGQKKQVRKSLLIGKRPVRKYALKTVLYFNSLRSRWFSWSRARDRATDARRRENGRPSRDWPERKSTRPLAAWSPLVFTDDALFGPLTQPTNEIASYAD